MSHQSTGFIVNNLLFLCILFEFLKTIEYSDTVVFFKSLHGGFCHCEHIKCTEAEQTDSST